MPTLHSHERDWGGSSMRTTGFLLAIGVVLVITSTAAPAQTIYQCTTNGNVAYQDTPCTGRGVKSRKLSLDTSPSGAQAASTPAPTSSKPGAAAEQTLRMIASQQRVLRARIRGEEAFMQAEMDA